MTDLHFPAVLRRSDASPFDTARRKTDSAAEWLPIHRIPSISSRPQIGEVRPADADQSVNDLISNVRQPDKIGLRLFPNCSPLIQLSSSESKAFIHEDLS
jgi:hypothetical protein